jgi:hypothetical protein
MLRSLFVLSKDDTRSARVAAIGGFVAPLSVPLNSAKVFPAEAESNTMDHEITPPADSNDPTFLRARALSLSVGAIRKAQGKKCPGDFPVGTIEWHAVVEDFANDVLKAMLSEPDLPILELRRDDARK